MILSMILIALVNTSEAKELVCFKSNPDSCVTAPGYTIGNVTAPNSGTDVLAPNQVCPLGACATPLGGSLLKATSTPDEAGVQATDVKEE